MTRQKFIAKPYQQLIIDHQLGLPRQGVWAGMGTGKTCSTLSTLDTMELVMPGPALVVAPLRVAQSTWPDESKKWMHLGNLEVVPILGTPDQRRQALKKPGNVFTINFENLPWLIEHLDGDWPFRKLVVDEATRLKGFRLRQGTQRAQALARVAHKNVDWFTELTGTPSPNGLQDLWAQAWFLDAGVRLGRSYKAFTDRWFRSERVGADPHAVRLEPLPFAREQIEDRLRDICISIDHNLDIKEPIVNVIPVELPAKARVLYRDMEREMFLAIGDTEVEAFNAASKTIKCLQIANGAIYTDDTGIKYSEIHDAKLQALESVIQEAAGMPVLVAYHFKSDLARLLKAFPKGRHLDSNPQTIRDWNAGKIPVLFAHPASAGHGLNLQDGGNILAFFGHWWDLEQYQQIIERIGPIRQVQAGYNRPVFIHHIVAAGTVDELVMARRDGKREVQDLLLESMKRRQPQ